MMGECLVARCAARLANAIGSCPIRNLGDGKEEEEESRRGGWRRKTGGWGPCSGWRDERQRGEA